MKKVLALILTVTMLFTILTSCSKKDDTIRIGLITPKTGVVAQYGVGVENAVNLAVDQINNAGGINGKKVQLITYDNKSDVTESVNVFNMLADNDKVVALIGPVITSTTLAVAPLANEKKIPMITPTATNAKVTPGLDYVFRSCFTDPYQGSTVAKFATENLGAKTAAILYNSGDDYSSGLAEAFKTQFETAGGSVTDYEGYTSDDKDFKSVLTNIKESAPDVLFIPDYYNAVGSIATQAKEVGVTATMLGGDGWDDVQKTYADVMEGGYFSNHYSTLDPDSVVQNFVSAYTEAFGDTPNALAALGYDGANIMMEAIKNAEGTDSDKILAALKATDMDCVAGHVKFDENGDPVKPIDIIKIEGGQLKLETKISGE